MEEIEMRGKASGDGDGDGSDFGFEEFSDEA